MKDAGSAVALMGNPNVGKSTVFNALTGGRQHTGNWSGKTVSLAEGRITGEDITLIDLRVLIRCTRVHRRKRSLANF